MSDGEPIASLQPRARPEYPLRVRFYLEAIAALAFLAIDSALAAVRDAVRFLLAPSSFGAEAPRFVPLDRRAWFTGFPLSVQLFLRIQRLKKRRVEGTPPIHWKGVQTLKDPLDLALYPMLLWELKPVTVIEIGAARGGSALWLADLLSAMGVEAHVWSFDVDLTRVEVSDARITFAQADSHQLSTLPLRELAALPHPWLVIEDAHQNLGPLLLAFDELLQAGDYLVVEDLILPRTYMAFRHFARRAGARYHVDTRFTDLFGYNATWNANGYLKRV